MPRLFFPEPGSFNFLTLLLVVSLLTVACGASGDGQAVDAGIPDAQVPGTGGGGSGTPNPGRPNAGGAGTADGSTGGDSGEPVTVATGGNSNPGDPATGGNSNPSDPATGGNSNPSDPATGGTAGEEPTTGGTGGSVGTGGSQTTEGTGGTPVQGGDLPWLHVDGNTIKNPSGSDVVLRGVAMIDLGTTEEWEGGARNMVDRLTDKNDSQGNSPGWYPTVLRLAVYPHDSPDHSSPFTYEPGNDRFYNDLLRPVVDYCREKGAYAIIDWHYIDDTSQHRETTTEFWNTMAPKFAQDAHVLFELYNEPVNTGQNFSGDWATVRSDMQSWYDTVRQHAPDNLVLVGTPNWCQQVGITATQPLDGSNIVYVAHMYPMHWESQELRTQVQTAAAAHPVFMSEWGFEEHSDEVVDGTISSYGRPFQQFLDAMPVSWTAWCASSSWFPSMFDDNYNLLVGEGYMGGFVKDWLYERRNDNLP
jgi:endoglucanase